jgi:hypothetical protein
MEYVQLIRRGEFGEGVSQAAEAAMSWASANSTLVGIGLLGAFVVYVLWRGVKRV